MKNLINPKKLRSMAGSIEKELKILSDGRVGQAQYWQAMLHCQTGIEWWSYRCQWPADEKAKYYKMPVPTMPAFESYQLMPAPRAKAEEHPFWEWYLDSCPQFFSTVDAAAMALSCHYAAWQRLVIHEATCRVIGLDLEDMLHGTRRVRDQKRINELLAHVR